MKKVVRLVVLITIGMTVVETSKILVIPFGLDSHINFMTTLGKALQDDGHEIWVLAYDKFEKDIKKRGLTPLTFPLKPEDDAFAKIETLSAESRDGIEVREKVFADPWWIMSFSRICDSAMQSERIMTSIQEKMFDLVVFDRSDVNVCLFIQGSYI
jgi:hypothetical protein